jgi:hypothetical protein
MYVEYGFLSLLFNGSMVIKRLSKLQTDIFLINFHNWAQFCKLFVDCVPPHHAQIELDLLRTLPNNKHYDSPYADGIAKLRRVLLAYSVHSPEVEYCQVRI